MTGRGDFLQKYFLENQRIASAGSSEVSSSVQGSPSPSTGSSTPSTVQGLPTPSTVQGSATSSTLQGSPTPSTVQGSPTPSTVQGYPTPSVINDKVESPSLLSTHDDSSENNSVKEKSTHSSSGRGSSQGSGALADAKGRGDLIKKLQACSLGSASNSDSNSGRGRAVMFNPVYAPSTESKISNEPENSSGLGSASEGLVKLYYKPECTEGKAGEIIEVTTNYIRLELEPTKAVYQYDVQISPPVDQVRLRCRLLYEHKESIGGVCEFDGHRTLLLPIKLPDQVTNFQSKDFDYKIVLVFTKPREKQTCANLYNNLFDRVMKELKYMRHNRKQFDPSNPMTIPQRKLEIWPGYITAIDHLDDGLMLCCNVSHRLLCQETVYDMMKRMKESERDPGFFQDKLKQALLGKVVLTRYNDQSYKIDDIDFTLSPMSTFKKSNGTEISYVDYYKVLYNITIRDVNQPMLVSRKKSKAPETQKTEIILCIVPELSVLSGLHDDMRTDFRLMRELATFTRITPQQRIMGLKKLYDNINNTPKAKQILADWGLSLSSKNNIFKARQFEPEQIIFGNATVSAGPKADFNRAATKNRPLEIMPFNNWVLVYCRKDQKRAKAFVDCLLICCKQQGIPIDQPKLVTLEVDRIDTFVNALRENVTTKTSIAVIICPTNRDDRYCAIKKVMCTEIPKPSQVINSNTLGNEAKVKQIVEKIMLQMNCKLGGALWAVKIPFKGVMICGADVYHDPARRNASVAAFVASRNESYTHWYSTSIVQTQKEELQNGLCVALRTSLQVYLAENGTYPKSVIMYRDGVSDSQFDFCLEYEICSMEKALKSLNVETKLTFIVVQKRINARIFKHVRGQVDNPAPGTIVDKVITRGNLYDFYLIAQHVNQGTVTPCRYIVLRDDSGYKTDILQRLTYKMTYMYYNWPGTIRVPAVCQYAHKCASLVGVAIRTQPDESLSRYLFYL